MSRYESWGRYPQAPPKRVERLAWRDDLPDLYPTDAPVLPYGLGRSYGDVCLNAGGVVLDTAGLDRIIAFDTEQGLLRCEAGVSLADVLALVVPQGWFLPVTPGTKWVTVAGAVANDVHGKNHHVAGTFGGHVTRMELVRSDGTRQTLTPQDPLFRATVGGLGLTGLITWVEFRLQPVRTDRIAASHTVFRSLNEFFELSETANARSPYVVAWLDALRPEGRGVLIEGKHADEGELPAPDAPATAPRISLPLDAPRWALSRPFVRAFNAAYFARQSRAGRYVTHYEPYFYPLDAIGHWNRGYGRRGLLQYQFVVPFPSAGYAGNPGQLDAVRVILQRIAESGAGSFLAVLKTFGDLPSPGMLSFPRPGVTLALDFANRGERTLRLLRGLDDVVRDARGRVYPAKDACMTGAAFRAFYPGWEAFAAHIDPGFSSSFWRRVMRD